MEKLKIKLQFTSAFATPIQSDTLFGEFCWHYRFLYGEEKLKKILEEKPAVVFSNGLPDGYLPMPIYPFKKNLNKIRLGNESDPKERWCKAQNVYTEMKDFKKVAYVRKELLERLVSSHTLDEVMGKLFDQFVKESKENGKDKNGKSEKNFLEVGDVFKSGEITRVSIDRRSGKALEGFLFQERSYYTEYPISVYLLYDSSKLTCKEIKETFEFMGISGFGAKKGVGKGKFEFEFEKWDLEETTAGRGKLAFISLSTGHPRAEEVEDFYAEFFTKFPKHGREFGQAAVFKNPVVVAKQGSVFIPKEKKEFYGKFENLSKDPEHLHSLHIIPLFVEL